LADKEDVEPEMAALHSLVTPGQIVVDIGANVGFYTKRLSHLVGPSGRVLSFEPISENFKILDRVVRKGHLANVQLFSFALDREAGVQEMVIPDRSDFTGFYQARLAGSQDFGRRQQVIVTSLDQLWNDRALPPINFIKCDAEGNELRILQGGIELLKRSHPSLLLEIQPRTSADVFDLLHGLGYKSFVLDGAFVETRNFDPKSWNYFFLEQTKAPDSAPLGTRCVRKP
jgi:FkbM family methyltransferase